MKVKLGVFVVGFSLLCSTGGLVAHHSFAAEYDRNRPFTVTGVVTKFEWTNPHARFYVDVVDEKGTVTNWNMELASPSALARNGWTSRTLKVSDQVTVKGFGGKVVATRGNPTSVVLADGRSLFVSRPIDDDAPGAR